MMAVKTETTALQISCQAQGTQAKAAWETDTSMHSVQASRSARLHNNPAVQQTHLHATAQAQHQVQRRLLLDVVVGQGAAILKLLAGKDQALLVGWDACSM
jgi:hypothetical protein